MSIGTDATDEEVDASRLANALLVVGAFLLQVVGVAVEDVDVLLRAVDIVEEVRRMKLW